MSFTYSLGDITNIRQNIEKSEGFLLGSNERGILEIAFDHSLDTSFVQSVGAVTRDYVSDLFNEDKQFVDVETAKKDFGLDIKEPEPLSKVKRLSRIQALDRQFQIRREISNDSFVGIKSFLGSIAGAFADPLLLASAVGTYGGTIFALRASRFANLLSVLKKGTVVDRFVKATGTVGVIEGFVGVGIDNVIKQINYDRNLNPQEALTVFAAGAILSSIGTVPAIKDLNISVPTVKNTLPALVYKDLLSPPQFKTPDFAELSLKYASTVIDKDGIKLGRAPNVAGKTYDIVGHSYYFGDADKSSIYFKQDANSFFELLNIDEVDNVGDITSLIMGGRHFRGKGTIEETHAAFVSKLADYGIVTENIPKVREIFYALEDSLLHQFDSINIFNTLDAYSLLRSADPLKDWNALISDVGYGNKRSISFEADNYLNDIIKQSSHISVRLAEELNLNLRLPKSKEYIKGKGFITDPINPKREVEVLTDDAIKKLEVERAERVPKALKRQTQDQAKTEAKNKITASKTKKLLDKFEKEDKALKAIEAKDAKILADFEKENLKKQKKEQRELKAVSIKALKDYKKIIRKEKKLAKEAIIKAAKNEGKVIADITKDIKDVEGKFEKEIDRVDRVLTKRINKGK